MLFLAATATMLVSSCATVRAPLSGVIYTNVHAPIAATSNANATKTGTAKAKSILGIVATGDASINTAARNGGITKIHHVDEHSYNVLGILARYEVTVYGE